jgi:hypothetical protein
LQTKKKILNFKFIAAGLLTIAALVGCGPTSNPTVDPTVDPTTEPSIEPTVDPTTEPSIDPTVEPSVDPTEEPTVEPSVDPTVDPTEDPIQEPTKVYYRDNRMTSKMYAYCGTAGWGTILSKNWPGDTMTKVDGRTDDLYYYVVPENASMIIFNNNSGAQTADLTLPSTIDENNCFYDGKTWAPIPEDKPMEKPEFDTISIIGTVLGGAWTIDTFLDTTDGETYTFDDLKLNANEEFKLRLNSDWATSWGYSNVDSASRINFGDKGGNILVKTAGTYDVTFVKSTAKITLTLN